MSGPCTLWPIDDDCCVLPEDVEQSVIDYWQGVSSEILWRASGMRYGTCEVTARPCLRRCGGGSGFPFVPYKGSDGAWRNLGCGCVEDCSCTELCEIVLPGPVASITQVLIDGTELEDTNYRLDRVGDEQRLLRTDGSCWPTCSDTTADCGDEGAFCVTYEQGIPLDALAIAANSQLTCELVRSCIPNCACLLPKNVAATTRRGVTVTFDTAKPWLRSLPMVASFLDAVNPEDLSSPSSVWSPDVARTRITTSELS